MRIFLKHPKRRSVIVVTMIGLLVSALLALYVVNPTIVRIPVLLQEGQMAQIPCPSTDAAYCTMMRRLMYAVTSGDYSLLLSSQRVTLLDCAAVRNDTHCQGITDATLALYAISDDGSTELMTHNQYINFFRSFSAQAGTLTFTRTSSQNGIESLYFGGKHANNLLELRLQKDAHSWFLALPVVSHPAP